MVKGALNIDFKTMLVTVRPNTRHFGLKKSKGLGFRDLGIEGLGFRA